MVQKQLKLFKNQYFQIGVTRAFEISLNAGGQNTNLDADEALLKAVDDVEYIA